MPAGLQFSSTYYQNERELSDFTSYLSVKVICAAALRAQLAAARQKQAHKDINFTDLTRQRVRDSLSLGSERQIQLQRGRTVLNLRCVEFSGSPFI